MPKIFSNVSEYKYEVQYAVPTNYGELSLTKTERDGYECVLVWPDDEYISSRPVLIRVENNKILWGAFDATTETIEIEVEGEKWYRKKPKKTEWFILDDYPVLQETVLFPVIKLLLEK